MTEELKLIDSRVEFIAMFLLKSFKMKSDKWIKMYSIDDNKNLINDFLEGISTKAIISYTNVAGAIIIQSDFPPQLKSKTVYFIKKKIEPISKNGQFVNDIIYGDLSQSPIDQIAAILDGVSMFYLFETYKTYKL